MSARADAALVDRAAFAALCALIITLPIEALLILPGIGTVSRLAGLVALPLVVLATVAAGEVRLHPVMAFSALLIGWVTCALFWSMDVDGAWATVFTYLQLMVLVWMLVQMVGDEARLNAVLAAFVAGTGLAALFGLHTFVTDTSLFWGRYVPPGIDPNDHAVVLALAIPAAFHLALVGGRAVFRLLALVYLPLAAAGILLTASRAGLIALAVAGLYVVVHLRHLGLGGRAIAAGGAFGLAAALAAIVPPEVVMRLGTTGQQLAGLDLADRVRAWIAGFHLIADYPLLGVGPGRFADAVAPYFGQPMAAHNLFVTTAGELGLIGLSLLVLLLWAAVRRIPELPILRRRLWVTMWLVILAAFLSLNWEERKITWMMITLSALHPALLTAGVRSQSAARSTASSASPRLSTKALRP